MALCDYDGDFDVMRVLWGVVDEYMIVRRFDSSRGARGLVEDVWRQRISSRASTS